MALFQRVASPAVRSTLGGGEQRQLYQVHSWLLERREVAGLHGYRKGLAGVLSAVQLLQCEQAGGRTMRLKAKRDRSRSQQQV